MHITISTNGPILKRRVYYSFCTISFWWKEILGHCQNPLSCRNSESWPVGYGPRSKQNNLLSSNKIHQYPGTYLYTKKNIITSIHINRSVFIHRICNTSFLGPSNVLQLQFSSSNVRRESVSPFRWASILLPHPFHLQIDS